MARPPGTPKHSPQTPGILDDFGAAEMSGSDGLRIRREPAQGRRLRRAGSDVPAAFFAVVDEMDEMGKNLKNSKWKSTLYINN